MKTIIAAAILAVLPLSSAFAAELPTVRISTGGKGNPYWNACEQKLKPDFKTVANIVCLDSEGSVQNLNRLHSGEADLSIVQASALAVAKTGKYGGVGGIDQIGAVGEEYTQLVCNVNSGIATASDLEISRAKRPRVLVGSPGSGAAVDLANWIIEDEDYANIEPAYKTASAGALDLKEGRVACALVISALGGDTMTKLDAGAGKDLKLVAIDDGDFNDSTDIDGNDVYRWSEIPSSAYKNLMGYFDKTTTVQSAFLVGRTEFTGSPVNREFMDALNSRLFLNANLLN